MKEDANEQYLIILNALGAHIAEKKNDLVFANYEIKRLERRLEEANEEITKLKGE